MRIILFKIFNLYCVKNNSDNSKKKQVPIKVIIVYNLLCDNATLLFAGFISMEKNCEDDFIL